MTMKTAIKRLGPIQLDLRGQILRVGRDRRTGIGIPFRRAAAGAGK